MHIPIHSCGHPTAPAEPKWIPAPKRSPLPQPFPLRCERDLDPKPLFPLLDTAAEFGLPFGELKRVSNRRLAQELAAWAGSRGRERAVHEVLFRAFFVEGKDIGDVAVLGTLAEDAGLCRGEAIRVLEARSFGELVEEDWARSRELGIRVAPTFVRNGRRLEGGQAV